MLLKAGTLCLCDTAHVNRAPMVAEGQTEKTVVPVATVVEKAETVSITDLYLDAEIIAAAG